jgi:hypothetical protein
MIFAELSAYDPPILIPSVLGCILFLVILWNQVKEAIKGERPKAPHPPNEVLDVAASDITRRVKTLETARADDAAGDKKDRGDLYNQIDKVRLELKHDIAESDRNTNFRINEVLAAVSKVQGELAASYKRT